MNRALLAITALGCAWFVVFDLVAAWGDPVGGPIALVAAFAGLVLGGAGWYILRTPEPAAVVEADPPISPEQAIAADDAARRAHGWSVATLVLLSAFLARSLGIFIALPSATLLFLALLFCAAMAFSSARGAREGGPASQEVARRASETATIVVVVAIFAPLVLLALAILALYLLPGSGFDIVGL